MSARRAAFYYGAQAALAVLVLAWIPAIRDFPLRVPVTYREDGLFLTILAKTAGEGGIFHAARFGAPFGSDLVDWPIGMWLPLTQMAGLTTLLGEPGAAINLYWLSTIVIGGLCATYALRRLGIGPRLAFVLGLLYAFQPYAFYRNVEHVNLAFPFVPLLALLLLRVAGTQPEAETRTERALTLAACAAQGLSYVYYSAFACLLFVVAVPIGCLRTRSRRPLARSALPLVLLVVFTAATVLPTLAYWKRHGFNPDLDYKPPKETELYALKLRHLLTPIADHPLAPFRTLAEKMDKAGFAGDNENALSRLGTVGAAGLLGLLAFMLRRLAGLLPRRDESLDGAAALTLAILLWATVGGLATFFNVLVMADIRAYARIVVFLSFFCLLAFGTWLARAADRVTLPGALRRPAAAIAPALLLWLGLLDQIPAQHLWRLRAGSDAAFEEERSFVRAIESQLPPRAMVFQLPHMTVPVDRATYPPMLYYDPGRAYLHSRSLRWSWGAMIGRRHDWGRAVDALPLAERAHFLALAGFSGIWIDRWGYTGRERPPYEAIERELASITGETPQVSSNGRYSFVSLESYRTEIERRLGPARLERLHAEALADMPILRWREGCGEEHSSADGWWRACGPEASIDLRNWRPGPIEVTLAGRIRAAGPAGGRLRVSGAFAEEVDVVREPRAFERRFVVEGGQTATLVTRFAGVQPCVADDASKRCFEVDDLHVSTRRVVRGMPVNDDGGLPVRTKD